MYNDVLGREEVWSCMGLVWWLLFLYNLETERVRFGTENVSMFTGTMLQLMEKSQNECWQLERAEESHGRALDALIPT